MKCWAFVVGLLASLAYLGLTIYPWRAGMSWDEFPEWLTSVRVLSFVAATLSISAGRT